MSQQPHSLPYKALADAVGARQVPENVPLKEPGQFKVIGHSPPPPARRYAAKTDGSAVFGIDVRLPGLKAATLGMCPVSG